MSRRTMVWNLFETEKPALTRDSHKIYYTDKPDFTLGRLTSTSPEM